MVSENKIIVYRKVVLEIWRYSMNYLIQAYACSPDRGGEFGVSWGWITHLYREVNDNDNIYIVSLTLKKRDLAEHNLERCHMIDIPNLGRYEFLHYNDLFHYIWLREAYKAVKKTGIHFDFIQGYSLSDYRKPGYWYRLKGVYTVFGPVGGAQNCPKSLQNYDSKTGKVRELINNLTISNPFFQGKIRKFSRVYACNYETMDALSKSELLPDVPLREDFRNLDIDVSSQNTDIPTILFCGRFINKKGILLLLDVLKQLPETLKYRCLLYGDGEQKSQVKGRITELKLSDKVFIKGFVQYSEMSKTYKRGQIFVLPSLRESGGNVLVEAAAHKLPIVALDMSLSHIFNEHHCGLFINTDQSKEEIIQDFAKCLERLILDPDLRIKLGENGYKFVNENMTWDHMMQVVYGDHNNAF